MFRYGGHNVQLDSSFKFGVDNLTPAFLKKFPLGKVIMVVMMLLVGQGRLETWVRSIT